jgi:hypothetical protein
VGVNQRHGGGCGAQEIFKLKPSKDSAEFANLIDFVSHVSPCYPTETAGYSAELMALLDTNHAVLDAALRRYAPLSRLSRLSLSLCALNPRRSWYMEVIREGTPTHIRHLPSGWWLSGGGSTHPARGATTGAPHQLSVQTDSSILRGRALAQALILMRNRGQLAATTLLPLCFRLFRCHDKRLRSLMYAHIVSDIQNSNKKHRDEKLNRSLQVPSSRSR